jgi:hypothetical protein
LAGLRFGQLGWDADFSGAQEEAVAHVFSEPHDVVRAPGIVEEAAMDSSGEVRLRAGEVERRLFAEGDKGSVEGFHLEGSLRVAACEARRDGMLMAAAGGYHVEGRDWLA